MDAIGQKSLEIMSKIDFYNKWTYSFFKTHLKDNVLEIGSGIGNFTKLYLDSGHTVVASEIQKNYINFLKKRFKTKKIKVVYGDIEKNKFNRKISSCGSVVCQNVLEHIRDDVYALANMRRKLKKGGRLILLVPAHMFLFGTLDEKLGHFRRYTQKNLSSKVKRAGFKIISVRYINFIATIGWYISGRILDDQVISERKVNFFNLISRPFLELEKFIKLPFGLSVLLIAEK